MLYECLLEEIARNLTSSEVLCLSFLGRRSIICFKISTDWVMIILKNILIYLADIFSYKFFFFNIHNFIEFSNVLFGSFDYTTGYFINANKMLR